jgi:hypothetical protein
MRVEDSTARVSRLGRRAGILTFALLVGGMTAIWSIQILKAVFAPKFEDTDAACRVGILELGRALGRARDAAARETGGESVALRRFRAELEPEWRARTGLGRACAGDPEGLSALKEIDALRYAEEHAVRYEAGAIAVQRRRTEQQLRGLEAPHTH